MGRHVDVGHLTEEECRHILDVVTKDFALRKQEQHRARKLYRKLEEMKRVIALKSSRANDGLFGEGCMICGGNLMKFCCVFSRGKDCLACRHEVCPKCRRVLRGGPNEHHLCLLCVKKREVKRMTCEWYYEAVELRFRRFGSCKALRAMHNQRINVEPRVITLLALMKDLSFDTKLSAPKPLSVLMDSKQGLSFEPGTASFGNKTRPRSRSSSEIMLSALGQKTDPVRMMRKTSSSSIEEACDALVDEQVFASTTQMKHVLTTSKSFPVTTSVEREMTSRSLTSSGNESADDKTSFHGNVLTEVRKRIRKTSEYYAKI